MIIYKLMKKKLSIFAVFVIFLGTSCSILKKTWDEANLFSVSQDVELGKKVSEEISLNTKEYPIVPETGNEVLYNYVRDIVKKLLNSGKVAYSKDFAWKVSIINNDKVQNAFATPGGYIFLYTGLMKYLDSEDQLAGVLGHEMAHAANRHSTRQLTKVYGVQALADAALGNKETLKQITTALIGLSFSRAHETEADSFSVIYLCPTDYVSSGAAGFFKKIQGQATPPKWLSTHPNPSNRIASIEGKAKSLNCSGRETYVTRYAQMKMLINNIAPPPAVKTQGIPTNTNTSKPADGGLDSKGKPTGDQNAPAPSKKLKKGGI